MLQKKLEAYAIRNLHFYCWQILTIIRDNNPQAWKECRQQAVKLCTCQLRKCAEEEEHVFALEGVVFANVKESRVCQFLENLYFASDWCENPNQWRMHLNCQSYTIFFCCNSLQHTETLTVDIYFDSCLVFFA